jgi:hypothetical protein
MPSFALCTQCLQTIKMSNRRPTSPLSRFLIQFTSSNRRTNIRHISWLPTIFRVRQSSLPPNPPSTETQTKSTSLPHLIFPRPAPELVLTAALQEAQELREKEKESEIKRIQEQLIAYGESQPIDESTPASFQDPLGHLTFDEQAQYLANPPPEYLDDLLERAQKREDFDKTMFTADPVNQWHLCYPIKPDFGKDDLPPWIPWDEDKRVEVMEKFRRYDERYQQRIQNIFQHFDSGEARNDLKKAVTLRIRKDIQREAIAAAKKAKKNKREDITSSNGIDDPPLAVLEVKIYREIIRMRNNALRKAQAKFIDELIVFEDINVQGVLASVEKQMTLSRIMLERKKEIVRQKEALSEWFNMSSDQKAESVDWSAINNET